MATRGTVIVRIVAPEPPLEGRSCANIAQMAPATLGTRIAEARRDVGMTQARLAEATGIDRTAVSKIERGKRSVDAYELASLAGALERPMRWFLEDETDRDLQAVFERSRPEIRRLAQDHGAHEVRVFGSVATGRAGAGSDIDLLVRLERGRSLLDLVRLEHRLEELLGCSVDIVTEAVLKERMRDRVLDEAQPV